MDLASFEISKDDWATTRRCFSLAMAKYPSGTRIGDNLRCGFDAVANAHIMLPPMVDWQSIETAPKDGTDILIHCQDENVIVSAKWRSSYADGQGAWFTTDPIDRLLWIQCPTHWCPMPFPPSKDP